MLYLPKYTVSSHEVKLLYAPHYTETYKLTDTSEKEFYNKANSIQEETIKKGYYLAYKGFGENPSSLVSINNNYKEKDISFEIYTNIEKREVSLEFNDNRRCYCFNCKKFVRAKLEEYKITNNKYSFDREYSNEVYICPECGTSETSNNLRQLDRRYTLFNECFLDGNKLKLKKKSQYFAQYNNHIFINKELEVIVMNLDTGMTYKLPTMINGKPKKKEKIRNITYIDSYYYALKEEKYSAKCKDQREVLEKAFELIRQYKIEHNGYYIPTKEEQIQFALSNGKTIFDIYEHKYKNQEEKYSFKALSYKADPEDYYFYEDRLTLRSLLMFNRFPAMNIYLDNQLYSLEHDYYYNNESYKKLKRLRGQIKQSESNPVKALANKVGIPYSKALKKVFDKDIRYMLIYKAFTKLNINRDNILKLLSISPTTYYRSIDTGLLNLLVKTFPHLRTMPTFNENGFINRIVRSCNESYDNYSKLSDTLNSILNIREYEEGKDYAPNLKDDIKTLHDKVMSDERKFRTQNRTIVYEEEQLNINGTFNGLHFALAKDTHELIDVGSIMNICVGGYGDRAIRHTCYIVVARNDNGEPIICIEVKDDFLSLEQTKLKYNNHPKEDSEEYKAIIEWCHHANKLPVNYEIDNYTTTKQFLVDHKDLVKEYNKKASIYNKINLDDIKKCLVKRVIETKVVETEDDTEDWGEPVAF